jgi:hypothetical protein
MDKKLWETCQMFVDAGLTEFIVDSLVKEVSDNLTPKQMKPLGDLRSVLLKIQPSKNGVTVDKLIKHLITLARKGAIVPPQQ